jgi:hypothetical protein
MTGESIGDATARTGAEAGRFRSVAGQVTRWVFRLVMAVLVVMLAVRTYEETAVAHARSTGSLRTVAATVTEVTSHTESGRDGGGQDGGSGHWTVTTTYTIELRVGDELKTADHIEDLNDDDFHRGQPVEARLWHGRIVEIDGHDVWPGWHPWGWDMALFMTYPVTMAYLIALAGTATTRLAGLRGRVRLEQEERMGSFAFGLLAAVATCLTLIVFRVLGHWPVFWPAIPAGAGILAVLVGLRRKLRQTQARVPA